MEIHNLARAGGAGGVLRNTGLNFETDRLTGFPTLDPTARNTTGGAIGLQNLFSLEQQLVGEIAVVILTPKTARFGRHKLPGVCVINALSTITRLFERMRCMGFVETTKTRSARG